jgi:hypothetical protein
LIIVTDWIIWQKDISNLEETTALLDTSNIFKPISLSYLSSDGSLHYLLLIPITTTAPTVSFTNQLFYLNRILLPYSYDVPNYNIYLTQDGGDLIAHKKYINSGPGVFYPVSLNSV